MSTHGVEVCMLYDIDREGPYSLGMVLSDQVCEGPYGLWFGGSVGNHVDVPKALPLLQHVRK